MCVRLVQQTCFNWTLSLPQNEHININKRQPLLFHTVEQFVLYRFYIAVTMTSGFLPVVASFFFFLLFSAFIHSFVRRSLVHSISAIFYIQYNLWFWDFIYIVDREREHRYTCYQWTQRCNNICIHLSSIQMQFNQRTRSWHMQLYNSLWIHYSSNLIEFFVLFAINKS